MTQLRREYPAACKFLNETNHIENNYVFQLNPKKYLCVPQLYISEIKSFLLKQGLVLK